MTILRDPVTRAVSLALRDTHDPRARSDLLFLEAWEMQRPADLGRDPAREPDQASQPGLVAAIERELKAATT